MKKIILLFSIAAFSLASSSAKAQSFSEGDNVLNLTVGFGSGVYSGAGYTVSPALAVSMEHCFWDNLINGDFSIGIGGYLGFQTSKTKAVWAGREYGYRYTSIVPAARGTFHWTGVDKLDTYAGVSIGGNIATSNAYGDWPFGTVGPASNVGGAYVAPFVGARWYFTDSFCATAEMGSGIAYFNIGVGFKF